MATIPAIEIILLTISPDSEYLQFRVCCPSGYLFNGLNITKYDVYTHDWEVTTGTTIPIVYDASQLISNAATAAWALNPPLTEVSMQFSKDVFNRGSTANNEYLTLFKLEFTASSSTPGVDALTATGLCSNINFVYANLLDLILAFTNCCISETDYDNLDRNHMILYAHTEAMRLGREIEAMFFYDVIWHLFVNCGSSVRQNNIINKPCNCD